MAKFESGALEQIAAASSRALAIAVPFGTTYPTAPQRSASRGVSTRPVSIMSCMRANPISRAMRTEPPPPTKMPRAPSGNAKNVVSSATRTCAHAAISKSAAERRAVQCGDDRDLPARDRFHLGTAGDSETAASSGRSSKTFWPTRGRARRKSSRRGRRGSRTWPRSGARDRRAQLFAQIRIERVALVRAIESDQRDFAVELVGDDLLGAHQAPWTTGFAEDADLGDVDLDRIAGFHPQRRRAPRPDAGGRAGCDDVAGFERRDRREIFDDARDRVDQQIGGRALHFGAVEAGDER